MRAQASPASSTLGRLLAFAFALLALLTLLGAGLGSVALLRVDAATTEAIGRNLAAERHASEIRRLVAVNTERYKAMALSSEASVQEALTADVAATERAYHALLDQLRSTTPEGEARQRLAQVEAADAGFRKAVASLRAAIDTNFTARIQQEHATRFLPAARALLDAVDGLAATQRAAIDAAGDAIHRQSVVARWLLLAFALAAVVLSALMARWLAGRISRPIFFASETAARVAGFDLAQDIVGHARDEAGRLLAALGRMQENLRQLVTQVSGSAQALHLAASEMAHGNQDLAQRTEETAGSLDRTAAALEQITRGLHASGLDLTAADGLAARAATQAVDGGALVAQLVQRMQRIEQEALRVTDIVSMIDGIAFQTNLLALNAAVEAARAGQHGRGFAVVAAEVRSLSQRTAAAAREVKTLVSQSMDSVAAGSVEARRAGEAVEGVVGSMQALARSIREVAARTQSQGAEVSEVNAAMARVSEATQQNASLVEQSSAAAHHLREQAELLSALISRFVLPRSNPASPSRLTLES